MMITKSRHSISFLLSLMSLASIGAEECKPVTTVDGFDLDEYISKPWYVHQQAVTQYSPLERNYCTFAQYEKRDRSSFWGYTVNVDNYAQDENGKVFGGPLCAYQEEDSASKLAVAPCWLPTSFAGPYWVVAYNETEGYALVSGGQPTIPSVNGTCRTTDGTNNAGLWIFLRSPDRDDDLIDTVRDIASDAGFDLTVLNDVDQEGCYDEDGQPVCRDSEGTFRAFFRERDCDWVGTATWLYCYSYGDSCPETCGQC